MTGKTATASSMVVRRRGERGSALIIVFVFAAIILIMLYRELPVTTFEARRQREQLLVDRGHEYQRAVQLFYRRFKGQYPASLDQLENMNSLRFLRRRYKDPMTGKDDWRLLHAGPGGMLMDSKVNQPNLNKGSNSSSSGSSLNQTTPASPMAGSNEPAESADGQTIAPVKKSAPAIAAGGGGPEAGGGASDSGTPTSAELDQDPSRPLLPSSGAASDGTTGSPGSTSAAANGTTNMAANGGTNALGQNNGPGAAPGAATTGTTGTSGTAPGVMQGGTGGIAGVASIAKGPSIKKVNDQKDYSLWEFWYDPSKDTGVSGAGMGTTPTINTNSGAPGMATPTATQQQLQSGSSPSYSNQNQAQPSPSPTAPTQQ